MVKMAMKADVTLKAAHDHKLWHKVITNIALMEIFSKIFGIFVIVMGDVSVTGSVQ